MKRIGLAVLLALAGCAGSDGGDAELVAHGVCDWAIDRGPSGKYVFEVYSDGGVEVTCGRGKSSTWKCMDDGITLDRVGNRIDTMPVGAFIGCDAWKVVDGVDHKADVSEVVR